MPIGPPSIVEMTRMPSARLPTVWPDGLPSK